MDSYKRWRQKQKAQGLCQRCGSRPPDQGITYCRRCLETEAHKRMIRRGRQRIQRMEQEMKDMFDEA